MTRLLAPLIAICVFCGGLFLMDLPLNGLWLTALTVLALFTWLLLDAMLTPLPEVKDDER